jgi:hypothetical protein
MELSDRVSSFPMTYRVCKIPSTRGGWRIEGKYEMAKVNNGTKVPAHGLFYMENAGGYGRESAHPDALPSTATDERRPSCFALEEEKGEDWKGSGAMGPAINQTRPSL